MTTASRLHSYIQWTNRTASALRGQVDRENVDDLVLTPSYRRLAALLGSSSLNNSENPSIEGLLNAELAERFDELQRELTELEQQHRSWSSGWARRMVLDTNVYLKGPKIEDLRQADLKLDASQQLCLVVPSMVLDELDKLKSSNDKHVRWRAGLTSAVIYDRLRSDSTSPGVLREKDADGAEITIVYLPDPPGHRRLPIADDEIIRRTCTLVPLTKGNIGLITYDAGMALRSELVDLDTIRLVDPVEKEPEPEPPAPKQKRQGRSSQQPS
jgi:hypothetical protein